MRFIQVYDGEWVRPRMTGWQMKCCDCGLVHTLQFRTVGKHVEFRAWRQPRHKYAGQRCPDVIQVVSMKKINPDTIEKHAGRVILELMGPSCRRATAYLSPEFVITATRRFRQDKRNNMFDFVMKIGVPNYREREFIKACKKSGVAFPLREPQLQFWPAKAKKSAKKFRRKTKPRLRLHVVKR